MPRVDMIKRQARTATWVGVLLLIAGVLSLIAPLASALSIAVMIGVLFMFWRSLRSAPGRRGVGAGCCLAASLRSRSVLRSGASSRFRAYGPLVLWLVCAGS